MNELLYLMGSTCPLTDEILESDVGIEKEGHRQRVLYKLTQEYQEFSTGP